MDPIVIVDESPAVQRAIQIGLERAGVEPERIHSFDRGDDAVGWFTALVPRVVFLEDRPQGIDAYDALQAMLLEEPKTRVIVVTERPRDDEGIQALLSFGAFGVLPKPVRTSRIRELMNRIEHEEVEAGQVP